MQTQVKRTPNIDVLIKSEPFIALLTKHECALFEVETKLNILSKDFAIKNSRNPFESIKSRIKKPKSICPK